MSKGMRFHFRPRFYFGLAISLFALRSVQASAPAEDSSWLRWETALSLVAQAKASAPLEAEEAINFRAFVPEAIEKDASAMIMTLGRAGTRPVRITAPPQGKIIVLIVRAHHRKLQRAMVPGEILDLKAALEDYLKSHPGLEQPKLLLFKELIDRLDAALKS